MNAENGSQPPDLTHALKVVARLVADGVRWFPGSFIIVPTLSVAALVLQSGLVLLLLALVARITPSFSNASPSLTQSVNGILTNIGTAELGILACICVAALTLVRFVSQIVSVKLATQMFRSNMVQLTDQLVEMRNKEALLYNTTVANALSAFTNGCRYAGVISARAVTAVLHLLSVPVLLGICIYLAPALTGLFVILMLIALPFHIFLMRSGITATREMLAAAPQHRSSKNELLNTLAQSDLDEKFDPEALVKAHVTEGSTPFLRHFEKRRALAAYSSLVTGIVSVAVIVIIVLSLSGILNEFTPPIDRLVAFAVAIRFLADAGGSLASFITTTVSVTPLLEQLHALLTRQIDIPPPMHGTQALWSVLNDEGYQAQKGAPPDHLIITQQELNSYSLKRIFSEIPDKTLDFSVLEGKFPDNENRLSTKVPPGNHEQTMQRLADVAPANILEAAKAIIEGNFKVKTPADRMMRIKVSIFADLVCLMEVKPKRVFMNSTIAGQLGRLEWKALTDCLKACGAQTIMVMTIAPRRLPADFDPTSVWFASFFDIIRVEEKLNYVSDCVDFFNGEFANRHGLNEELAKSEDLLSFDADQVI